MSLSFDLRRAVHEVLSFDTSPGGSNRQLLGYLMDLLYYGDFRIVEQAAALTDSDQANLVGTRGPGALGGLLLCASMETPAVVDPSRWTETEEDPFNPTERDGLIFALGATSGKVDLVCKILAAASIEASDLVRPVVVAGLFGRESRVGGAMYLLDSGICHPEWAVVGEPTNLELVRAHRGYVVLRVDVQAPPPASPGGGRAFRIEVAGESAHSTTPSLGANAIDIAFQTVRRWRAEGHDLTVHGLSGGDSINRVPGHCTFVLRTGSADWRPSGPRLVVEAISADACGPAQDPSIARWEAFMARLHELFRWTAPDTAPDFLPATPIYNLARVQPREDGLTFWLDYRTLPGQRTAELVRDVEILARRESRDGASVVAEVERNLLPMDGSPDSPLLRAARASLREVGIPPVVGTYPGYAEGWIFDAARIDTVVFGPGYPGGVSHRPNEYTILRHLEKATAFYERLIRRLCC